MDVKDSYGELIVILFLRTMNRKIGWFNQILFQLGKRILDRKYNLQVGCCYECYVST
jgi:hypothetical protein